MYWSPQEVNKYIVCFMQFCDLYICYCPKFGNTRKNKHPFLLYSDLVDYITAFLHSILPMTCSTDKFFLQTKLDGFLAAPDHLMLPHTRLLLASTFRRTLQQRTAEAVCMVYKKLYEIVHDPNHGYTDPSSLLPRDPETVKTLLS